MESNSIRKYEFKESLPLMWKLPPSFQFSIEELRIDTERLLERIPFTDSNQILLTSDQAGYYDPYTYAGSLFNYSKREFIRKETDFRFFNPELQDLIFFKIYLKLQQASPLPIGRVRLLKLKPKSCYSMHKDDGIRYHMAIKTHEQAFLIFQNEGAIQIPADGCIYGVNTMISHSAMNGGMEERIHLVFGTSWNQDIVSQSENSFDRLILD